MKDLLFVLIIPIGISFCSAYPEFESQYKWIGHDDGTYSEAPHEGRYDPYNPRIRYVTFNEILARRTAEENRWTTGRPLTSDEYMRQLVLANTTPPPTTTPTPPTTTTTPEPEEEEEDDEEDKTAFAYPFEVMPLHPKAHTTEAPSKKGGTSSTQDPMFASPLLPGKWQWSHEEDEFASFRAMYATQDAARRQAVAEAKAKAEAARPTTTRKPHDPNEKPFDAWKAVVEAREFLEKKNKPTSPPPTEPSSTVSPEDNFFEWKKRQDARMVNLYKGNPHFDNRLEWALERRHFREYMHSQHGGSSEVYMSEAEAVAQMEEEDAIIKEFDDWAKENDARNERMRKRIELKNYLENKMSSVEVEADYNDYDGFHEQMTFPQPSPDEVLYKRTIRVPALRRSVRMSKDDWW